MSLLTARVGPEPTPASPSDVVTLSIQSVSDAAHTAVDATLVHSKPQSVDESKLLGMGTSASPAEVLVGANRTWPVRDIDVRCLPFPGFEAITTRFVGTMLWPWVPWLSSFISIVGIGIESEVMTVVFAILALTWALPALCTVDPRAWRLLLTVPNAWIVLNACINLGCVMHIAGTNNLNAPLTAALLVLFVLIPTVAILIPLMDHDLYGIMVICPTICLELACIFIKFYATGVFVALFVGHDVPLSVWGYRFSPFVLMVGSCAQVFAILCRIIYFARDSRAGFPQRLLGVSTYVAVRYRPFSTDLLLSDRGHVLFMWAMHAAAFAIAVGLIAWKGSSR